MVRILRYSQIYMAVDSVWVRRAPETAKGKLKSKKDFTEVKAEELLVLMPVHADKLSAFAATLVSSGALAGETLRLMIYGTTKTDHKSLHGDVNVVADRFTATVYLPFMNKDESVEEYVERIADQLSESASQVKGTIIGVMVGLEQIALKRPVKTF